MGAAARAGILAGLMATVAVQRYRRRESRARAELDRVVGFLPSCPDVDQALFAIERAFVSAFGAPLAVISTTDGLTVKHRTLGFRPEEQHVETIRRAISESRIIRQLNGNGTESYYLPLLTWRGAVGAVVFARKRAFSRESWKLIRCFRDQIALTLLRSALANQAEHATCLCEADRFQKALLNSIAHNVRTPLASIIGVLSTLQDDDAMLNLTIRRDLIETARQEADRLNRLLGNLLDFSRIEAQAVQVRADPCDVQDLIGAALEQLGGPARDRAINVQIDPSLPLVHMDFVLIVQVLVNLLDNAVKYSNRGTAIEVTAKLANNSLELRVEDSGDGVAEEDLSRVFEKFNRAGRTGETGGIGLGLSICKGLVEAHRGQIWAERRSPNGTAVAFRLPLTFRGKG